MPKLKILTRRSPRTCKYQIAGKRLPNYRDVASIMHSDFGWSLIEHIMSGANPAPAWWRDMQRTRSLAVLRRNLETGKRQLELLETATGE